MGSRRRSAPLFVGLYKLTRIVIAIVIVVMPHMVIGHVVAAAEALAKILALVAGKVRVAEVVVTVRIRLATCVDVVARGFNTVAETAVPCMGPGAIGLDGLPGSWRGWAFLRVNGEGGTPRQRKA